MDAINNKNEQCVEILLKEGALIPSKALSVLKLSEFYLTLQKILPLITERISFEYAEVWTPNKNFDFIVATGNP
jgi:hypothetical protein